VRISPADLQAVRRGGMLTRYALMGPAAFVLADLPTTGTAGTGLDEPCLTDHHGIVIRGTFSVHHANGRTEDFRAGDAFYVAPGPPTHIFTSSPRCVVGGFARLTEPLDTTASALEAQGYTVVAKPTLPAPPPAVVNLAGSVEPFRRPGAVDVEGSVMGDWLFMRSRFGPRSGYTSGWCDLPHWGLVLDGEIAVAFEGEAELAARGDAFYTPPGHRFTSPDGATIIDYTPIEDLGASRISAWRRAAIQLAAIPDPVAGPTSPAAEVQHRAAPAAVQNAPIPEAPQPPGELRRTSQRAAMPRPRPAPALG
jgi:quercetin dioxygenase-like cupin family protein